MNLLFGVPNRLVLDHTAAMRTLLLGLLAPLACLAAACGGNVVVDGGGGSGGDPSTSEVSSTTTFMDTTTSVSTGPNPSQCDGKDVCTDGATGCADCAIMSICEDQFNACINDNECIDFGNCATECNGQQSCVAECFAKQPEGGKLYAELIDCIVCVACVLDCNGADFGDPFPGCPFK